MAFSLNLEKINFNKTAALKAKDTKINVNLEKNPNYSNYEEIDYNQGNIEIPKEESSLLTKISTKAKKVSSSTGNVLWSLGKGALSLVEGIGDAAIIATGAAASAVTAIGDVTYSLATKGEVEFNATKKMWKDGIIKTVSNNWVSDLDEITGISYNNDQYAVDAFKSTGVVCNVTQGIGTVAATVASVALTGGASLAGTGATAATMAAESAATSTAAGATSTLNMAVVAGIQGVGSGTETAWNTQIEQNQILNNISREEAISNLSTKEMVSGLGYGLASGAIDGVQWYAGGKINGLFKGATPKVANKFASAAIRVGLDTADGLAEIPIRTQLQTLYRKNEYGNNMSFGEVFEANGGWKSVAVQGAVALTASSIGEIFDARLLKKKEKNSLSGEKVGAVVYSPSELSHLNSELEQKIMEYNRLYVSSSDSVKRALINAENGYAVYLSNDLEVQSYIKLHQLESEILNLKETINNAEFISEGIQVLPVEISIKQEVLKYKDQLDSICTILDNHGMQNGLSNYSETALRKYAKTGSVYQILNGVQTPYITKTGGARDFIKSLDPKVVEAYLHYSTLRTGSIGELYSFFRNTSASGTNTYGVDQGGIKSLCDFYLDGQRYDAKEAKTIVNNAIENGLPIPSFKKYANSVEYENLKNKLISKGFTVRQASAVLSSIDVDAGACSYAAKANSIFYKFSKNPEFFEECFGFPMYKVNANGQKVLNSNELLLDMYVYANDVSNGGRLFVKNASGEYVFNEATTIDALGRKMLDTTQQTCMSTSNGSNNDFLSRYLSEKGLKWDSISLCHNPANNIMPPADFNYVKDLISKEYISNGKGVQINIWSSGNEIRFLDPTSKQINTTTRTWGEGGGHAVFVTGMTNDGFIVSSWGKELLIPYEDLQNGGSFHITIDDISVMG